MDASSLHIAMFPWFAMGHLTPFLHLSNKLAKKGHRISFFIPRKTQAKLEHFNLYPHHITFVPLTVPHVDGLPSDAETSSDVPFSLFPLIMTALDRTEKDIELHLQELKPDLVFFDFQYWIPNLARRLGIKSVAYWIANPATAAYLGSPERRRLGGGNLTAVELMQPPSGFPDSSIKLHPHETRFFAAARKWEFGSGVRLCDRVDMGIEQSDALAFKGCREMEGPFVDYLEAQFGKPVLLSGPVIPEPPTSTLEEKWVSWLGKFKAGSVIYCALGSEGTLQQNQFQELLLGLELTGMPFLAVLKPPVGFDTIEAAMPHGFAESVQGRGIVHGGWVQQQLILEHPSVGCFITHCGASSITESLVNECQLVLMPRLGSDHIFNARLMGNKLKVGVEVEKGEEDGLFTKEAVCKAVRLVMDEESEVGKDIRANHAKLRTLLLSTNLESSCVDGFCKRLKSLLTKS